MSPTKLLRETLGKGNTQTAAPTCTVYNCSHATAIIIMAMKGTAAEWQEGKTEVKKPWGPNRQFCSRNYAKNKLCGFLVNPYNQHTCEEPRHTDTATANNCNSAECHKKQRMQRPPPSPPRPLPTDSIRQPEVCAMIAPTSHPELGSIGCDRVVG